MITLTLLIFLVYAYIEGIREAYYYHYKWKVVSHNIHDEHIMFTVQRALLIIGLSMISYPVIGWWCFLSIASMTLCFSFIHNGAQYVTRNNLDEAVYPDRFLDESSTTTAKFSFGVATRVTMFIIGTVSAVILDILNILKFL